MMNFGRPRRFPVGAHDEFFLQGMNGVAPSAGAGGGISARHDATAGSKESESELLHLIEAGDWELARVRAEAFAAEARPTSAAYRGISQTALSAAAGKGAPLETVRAILKANPEALVDVRHARRGTVLHEAIRKRAAIDVISYLVDEALRLEESLPVKVATTTYKKGTARGKTGSVPIWGQVDESNRTILHLLVSRICAAMFYATPRSTASSVINFRSPPHFVPGGKRESEIDNIEQMLDICGKIVTAYPESLTFIDTDGHNPLMAALIAPPPGSFAPKDSASFVDRNILRLVSMFCKCCPFAAEQSTTPNQIMGIMSGASLQRVARGGIRHVNRQHEVLTPSEDGNRTAENEEKNVSVNTGPNALYLAIVYKRSIDTIETILAANPSSNRAAYAIVTQQLETPLHVAVTVRAPLTVIQLLLKFGPEAVIAGDRHNLTPLDWVWIRHVLDRAHLAGRSNRRDDEDNESDATSVEATLPRFEPNRPFARRTIPSPFLQNWKDAASEIEMLSEAMNSNTKATKRMRVGSFTNYRVTTGALWERVSLMLPVAAREMYHLLEQTVDDTSEEWPVYHAASYVPCPVPLLDLAFFYYPDQVKQKDSRGFLPIHLAASNPYHDVTFDLPDSMTSGVSPYIRAQHRTSFGELSPIPRVIKHSPPEASNVVTPDGRLPLHIALEMIKDHQSTFRVACQGRVFATSVSRPIRDASWEFSRSIIRSLVDAGTIGFERQDPQTLLYPFMQAAVGNNADVDLIFLLLREHPSICIQIESTNDVETWDKQNRARQPKVHFEFDKRSSTERKCRYKLGQPVQRVFGMHQGRFEGVVTMLPTPIRPFYRVFYPADEDEEDIAIDEMPKYVVSNVGGLRYPNNSITY
jgi:hypothetical protein